MATRPKFKISRLREIGWTEWNPIGLDRDEYTEDEYDSYLLQAAGRLWNGASSEEVATTLPTSKVTTWASVAETSKLFTDEHIRLPWR